MQLRKIGLALGMTLGLIAVVPAFPAQTNGFGVDISVNGRTAPEYWNNGTTYVEAFRGNSYIIRLTNPLPYRVAVALAVDGLNSIDAKHTDAWSAQKWVLEPYESTEISGWQVSGRTARRFLFTGERQSYGAALGQTANLGVIEAVFYRERVPYACCVEHSSSLDRDEAAPEAKSAPRAQNAPEAASGMSAQRDALSDANAATGMGRRVDHEVRRVSIDLDPNAVASVRIRYEFRPQLVRLGIIPQPPTGLDRREHAHGFESYCPEP